MAIAHRSDSLRRPTPPRRPRMIEWAAVAAAVAVIVIAATSPGCSSSGGAASQDEPNAGLETLAAGSSSRPIVRTDGLNTADDPSELNLSDVLEKAAARKAAAAKATPPVPAPEPVVIAPVETAAAPARPAPEDPHQRVARLAGELRQALADRAGPRPTFSDAAAAVALEGVTRDTGGSGAGADLPPPQRRVLDAFRSVVSALTSGSAGAGETRAASEAFASAAAQLDDSKAVHVRRAVLCTRVSGFGRFESMASTGFVAGRPARFIVYTEVERFGHRPARDGDPGRAEAGTPAQGEELMAVELSQELSLWHDADGSAQWQHPEQTVVEVSRNRRHDFYLVQQVELPANLSVGKYNLKVSVKDRVSGAIDQAQIPIVIVADPSLTLAPGAR